MTWSAPNPYEGFESAAAAAPREAGARSRPTPSSAGAGPLWGTPPAPAGTPPSTSATIPVPATPPAPTLGPPARPPARHRGVSGASMLVIGVLVTVVVVVVGVIVGVVRSTFGDSGGPPFGGGPDELDAAWTVDTHDLASGYGAFGTPDGSITTPLLTTSTGWVTMVEPGTPEAVLVSVDPDSGAVQWTAGVPEGRCTQTESVEIVCLTRSGGSSAFQLATIDVSTGDVVGDRVDADIAAVPALLVPLGDGLLTLSVTGTLTGLGLDGSVRWSQPIGLPDLDLSYQQIDVAQYPDSVLLYFGWVVGASHVTAGGEVTNHACDGLAATPEAWLCQGQDTAVGFAPDGTELWRAPWDGYYLVTEYQRIAPIALTDNWDGTVSLVDPVSGEHGSAVRVSGDSSVFASLVGSDPEHPIITTDSSVLLLDAEVTRVLWEQPVSDEYLNIAGGGVIDDQVVIDGEFSHGFDLAGGEEIWERDFLAADVWVHDGALVGYAWNELIRYQLP